MSRSRIIALISVLSIGLSIAGCANQPPPELQDVAAPKENEQTGGERTAPTEERAVLTGVDREPGEEASMVRSILVEEPPNDGCGEGPTEPGCEKIHFRVIDETHVLREEGGREVPASAGVLKKGQRVRADYTGYPVAESYPAQTTAGRVVILESAPSSSASGVFFPRQRPENDTMISETRGGLILDDQGCLRVRGTADL
jgi:hypothetical protein